MICKECKEEIKPYYYAKFYHEDGSFDKRKTDVFYGACQNRGMLCPNCFDKHNKITKL